MLYFPARAAENKDFAQWLAAFYPEAHEQGISRETWETAFAGVVEPYPEVLSKANYQPEFTTEIWDYLDTRVNPLSVAKGEKMDRYYARTLAEVEKKFGVEKSVLLAIWSMESNFGAIFDKPDRLFYVPRALATLAYGDPKRQNFARTQLIAALQILQAGDVKKEQLTGSWAGAMGHTQFIPTSYLAYGVDMDGNGSRDIWTSIPDALATAANLLHKNGWRTGNTWGYEVVMPLSGEQFNEQTKTLAAWQKLGFKRSGGRDYGSADQKAVLKLLAGSRGPAFLMMKNFFVLKRYNNSDFYALAVGLLADRLAGAGGLVGPWPRPSGSLGIEEKIELQTKLQEKGFYVGEIDGIMGNGTKAAIRQFQIQTGMAEDGTPSHDLLQALRK
ncbi:MAG: lytic murein transglycosylase [Desulfobacterium sp.]|nr:lytic murein transglycosylase [Desulfobacterium sp.]